MAEADDNILPLIDRETPVIDAIRKRRSNGDSPSGADGVTEKVSKLIAEVVLEDDDDLIEEQRVEFKKQLRASFADNVGVDEEHVTEQFLDDVSHTIFDWDLRTTLSNEMLEEIGIEKDNTTDDDEESEVDGSDFI